MPLNIVSWVAPFYTTVRDQKETLYIISACVSSQNFAESYKVTCKKILNKFESKIRGAGLGKYELQ